MHKVDFLIIGQGLAGSVLAHHLLQSNQKVFIVDKGSGANSSRQATGLINPITGRRFVKSWLTDELMDYAQTYYSKLQKDLKASFYQETTVIKVLQSIEQQNDFSLRLNDENYAKYLEPKIEKLTGNFYNPFSCAFIKPALQIDVNAMQEAFLQFFRNKEIILEESFDFEALKIENKEYHYQNIVAKNIVFAEGYLLRNNPYFGNLPIQFAKGEVLVIESEDLQVDAVLNSVAHITPLGNNKYYVGATYDWNDDQLETTQKKYDYLINALNQTITVNYKVIDHKVGLRPTTKDRRPLIGEHPEHKNMFVFNGMGTKGLSLSPYLANQLVEHVLNGLGLHPEVDIKRLK